MDFESLGLPGGPFVMSEVYFDHDGPRLFSMKSKRWFVDWIGNCVAEDDTDNTVTYLFLRLERPRFNAVRAGAMELRDAFTQAGDGDLYQVVWTFPDVDDDDDADVDASSVTFDLTEILPQDLPEEWLPLSGARLDLPTASSEPFNPGEVAQISRATLRTVAAFELEEEGRKLTEFPLRGLGKIGASMQDVVDSTAQEIAGERTERGVIPRDITNEVRMSVVGLRAASFVILVGVDQDHLFEESFVEPVFESLLTLVRASGSPTDAELLGVLRDYGPRARGHFQALLKNLADYGTGLGLNVSTGEFQNLRSAKMTAADARRSLLTIGSVKPSYESLTLERASLTALNLTRRTFELSDGTTDRRYPGTVSTGARQQVDGLRVSENSYVKAVLEVEVDYAARNEESGRKYTLTSIEPL